jgi:hypothetical protein
VDDDRAAVDVARAIIDTNLYMTLATADGAGVPWPTPVYFVPIEHRDFLWVSSPEARHSQNIAARPRVGVVVFDSHAPISTGQAVYMSADAGLVPLGELERCVDVFSRACQARGGAPWSVDDLGAGSRRRLFRASASEHWILDDHDRRIPVPLGLAET